MKERNLTAKQLKFANNIIDGMTQADAYRNAYDVRNMSDKTVIEKASLLANQDNIRAMIEKGKRELESAEIWTRKQSLTLLATIAKADIKKYLMYKTAKTVVSRDPETGEPVIDYKTVVELLNSDDVDGSVIQEISLSKDGTLKFKLFDKLKAIELANRMCGYNEPDKVDANITVVLSGELEEWGV